MEDNDEGTQVSTMPLRASKQRDPHRMSPFTYKAYTNEHLSKEIPVA